MASGVRVHPGATFRPRTPSPPAVAGDTLAESGAPRAVPGVCVSHRAPVSPAPPDGSPIVAIALDGRVELAATAAALAWPEVRRYPYGVALEDPDGMRVFVFRFGAVVAVGRRRLPDAMRQALEAASGRQLLVETADVWTIVAGAAAPGRPLRVGWDRVVLPSLTPELVAVTAMLLGQSAAVERFEATADQLVRSAREMSEALVAHGRPPRSLRPLSVQVGRVNRDRLAMAEQLYILDRPEETWEHPDVSALYDQLLDGLELLRRREALLSKLSTVESATELVIDLWQSRESSRLEWAIVLLIVFEVLFMLAEAVWG